MRAVLLAPHNDDEALFASFVCLKYNPHVIICLRSQVQERRGYGITYQDRELETAAAMEVLDCDWEQWHFSDAAPPWEEIEQEVGKLQADVIFAPFPEGHAHHVRIGRIAHAAHQNKVRFYSTYTPEKGRSTDVGQRVEIEPHWVPLKLRALCCYGSQSSHPSCMEHFLREQWEYLT